MKACQRNWAEVFGEEANMFAVSPSNAYQKVREPPTPPPPPPICLDYSCTVPFVRFNVFVKLRCTLNM